MEPDIGKLTARVERDTLILREVETEIRKVIVGQDYLIERLLVGLLVRGHLLIEGVPGLAKTLAVKTLARTLHVDFNRIQFTPDLLPADLLGTLIYDQKKAEFVPRQGPLFTNLLLADEINRAPAKVQSALLESMEERQVTLGDTTYPLADPFMVLATQNPIEQEGTYPLAEAQVDRFTLKLRLDYPSRSEEEAILERMMVERDFEVRTVVDRLKLAELRQLADSVYLDQKMRGYILDLVGATRDPRAAGCADLEDLISFGASPRATLFLARTAKAMALLRGRGYVIPEDVKEIAVDVLRHRIVASYEAEAEEVSTDDLVHRLLDRVEVPLIVTLPTAAQAPLSDELMRKVRRIEISTRRLVDEGVAGEYHSVFKGRGMEFSEVRPYQPGDDIRSIDWNVTARMGTPFVKQYVESRDLTVFIVVDVSGSQNFGSRTILKREQAAEIAALLSFAALRNQDRVGAALVSDRLELFLPPRRSRTHALRLVREVLSRQGHGETDLDAAMPAVLRNLKQRSVLFLISDFVETRYSDALKAAKGRHDVVTIQISDPRDREIPAVGPIPLRDCETGRVAVLSGKRWAEAYKQERSAQHDALVGMTRRLSIDHLELRTDRPYIGALVSFFDRRRKRLQR